MTSVQMRIQAGVWWRRCEIWLAVGLLAACGFTLGYQVSQWSANRRMLVELSSLRDTYDAALRQRDQRLENLARSTGAAVTQAASAANKASQAVNRASEAQQVKP